MSTESLWNQNLLARYAHLPMAEERQQFLQHKLDEGSSWSSLRQLGIYIAAAVSRMQLTSESRLTPKAIDIRRTHRFTLYIADLRLCPALVNEWKCSSGET
jgi:hypothetical protein